MSSVELDRGPVVGEPRPVHGGHPSAAGCGGCVDCCHLPEISVTDEETLELQTLAESVVGLEAAPMFTADPVHEGWQIMRGPCVFRKSDSPIAAGGCRIYEDRPGACRIFTCKLLLELRAASR
ncbi:MAG TPA: hypothetical protein DEV93_12155 [Chloroflexi bacterium]|nr:hypothetical protein [Chloroflexota bacterium]